MYHQYSEGIIEVITGPMFSGKTEELIKRIRILAYAGIKTLIIKPQFDNRFANNALVSRSGVTMETHCATTVADIAKLLEQADYRALVIDEVQFFDKTLLAFVDAAANRGIRVIVSGLDQNFRREPFGIMPQLLAMAENVTKLKAVCLACKNAAACTLRKTSAQEEVALGDTTEYEARCRRCHVATTTAN